MSDADDRGLVIVYTGDGKGKTTAALGLCLRGVGHGHRILIIQFIKGDWEYGELAGLRRLHPDVEIKPMGVGCIGILGDEKPLDEHRRAATAAWIEAKQALVSGRYNTVILDEINIATHFQLLSPDEVVTAVRERPSHVSVVLTGRYADPRVIDAADLVTEMKEVKHPFRSGRLSKKGIDY
jgi:cob(I)alamin adenosyltransferase